MKENGKELEALLVQYKNDKDRKQAEELINSIIPALEKEYQELGLADLDFISEISMGVIIKGIRFYWKIPDQDKDNPSILAAFGVVLASCMAPDKDHDEIAQYMIKYVIVRDNFINRKNMNNNPDSQESIHILNSWYRRRYSQPPKTENGKKLQREIYARIQRIKQIYEREGEELPAERMDDSEVIRSEIDSYIGQEI